MTAAASNNAVGPGHEDRTKSDFHSVRVAVIYPDSSVDELVLTGTDSECFASVRHLAGNCILTPIEISDQDGPAAVGWVDAAGIPNALKPNRIASELTDRPVVGPMVVTGLGHGDADSMSSVHEGLRRVLGRMAESEKQR
jgi:hypothetical protein